MLEQLVGLGCGFPGFVPEPPAGFIYSPVQSADDMEHIDAESLRQLFRDAKGNGFLDAGDGDVAGSLLPAGVIDDTLMGVTFGADPQAGDRLYVEYIAVGMRHDPSDDNILWEPCQGIRDFHCHCDFHLCLYVEFAN